MGRTHSGSNAVTRVGLVRGRRAGGDLSPAGGPSGGLSRGGCAGAEKLAKLTPR